MTISFRVTVTALVMAIVAALAVLLIVLQDRMFARAVDDAATSSVAALSARISTNLDNRLAEATRLVTLLSAVHAVTGGDSPDLRDPAIELFRAVLAQVDGADSVYVGYANSHWLQVLRASGLTAAQRQRLQVPGDADQIVNLVHPVPGSPLPLTRRFLDASGAIVGQFDIPRFGYDARARPWYHAAMTQKRAVASPPYLSFSSGAPMITVSAPLQGAAEGVVAIDIRMDQFSAYVARQEAATGSAAIVFTADGTLLAYPDYDALLLRSSGSDRVITLPGIDDIREGPFREVLARQESAPASAGRVTGPDGRTWLYRSAELDIVGMPGARMVMIADAATLAAEMRRLQRQGLLIACFIGALFIPIAWLSGGHVSRQLRAITEQALRLPAMERPAGMAVPSSIREIRDLARAVELARKAIWSFSRFVPMEMVRRLLDDRLSTGIGGMRRQITVVFTDVDGFTSIAESADPKVLMEQTSRYFGVLTHAFLAEGGTIDKFIGDAVMVFWNAPAPQDDHVERACRAALAARAASEALNAQFEAEGLPRFRTRFGLHVGEAVVGNLGSEDRLNYTAIGNTVNLAARLEALNKTSGTQIMVSSAIRRSAGRGFAFRRVGRFKLKGMSRATTVYEMDTLRPTREVVLPKPFSLLS